NRLVDRLNGDDRRTAGLCDRCNLCGDVVVPSGEFEADPDGDVLVLRATRIRKPVLSDDVDVTQPGGRGVLVRCARDISELLEHAARNVARREKERSIQGDTE